MNTRIKPVALDPLHYKVAVHYKLGRWLAPFILFLADYMAVAVALVGASFVRESLFVQHYPYLLPYEVPEVYTYVLIPMVYLVLLASEKLYTSRVPFWKNIELLFKVSVYSSAITIGLLFFSHSVQDFSRLFLFFSWIFTFTFLIFSRVFSKKLLLSLGFWQKPVIIVGAGKTAELLINAFEDEPGMGYRIVGFIEDHPQDCPLTKTYPLLGTFDKSEQIIHSSGVQDVILATPGMNRVNLLKLIHRIQPYVKNLIIVPDLFEIPLANVEIDTLFNQKTVLIKTKNNMTRMYNRIFKWLFDYIVTSIGLLFISPILIVLAILIYVDSPGPVIFAHYRIGMNGKKFPCYKFRSMINNSQQVLKEYLAENPEAREE